MLSFPIDGCDPLDAGVPRQLGDVVICPQVVGESWQRPLVHGLLHLLGYDHGAEMEAPRGVALLMSATKPPERRSPFRRSPTPRPEVPSLRRGTPSIIQSFNYAFEGVIWVLRTQRNMRIHFAIAIDRARSSRSPTTSRSSSSSPCCSRSRSS